MHQFLSWEIFYGLGAVALGAGLIYGIVQYHSRNRRNDPITEEATRMEYDEPQAYADGGRERLQRQTHDQRQ